MKTSKVEIRKSRRNGQFRFVVIATNGEPLVTSESYTTKAKCWKGIAATAKVMAASVLNVVDTTTAQY